MPIVIFLYLFYSTKTKQSFHLINHSVSVNQTPPHTKHCQQGSAKMRSTFIIIIIIFIMEYLANGNNSLSYKKVVKGLLLGVFLKVKRHHHFLKVKFYNIKMRKVNLTRLTQEGGFWVPLDNGTV